MTQGYAPPLAHAVPTEVVQVLDDVAWFLARFACQVSPWQEEARALGEEVRAMIARHVWRVPLPLPDEASVMVFLRALVSLVTPQEPETSEDVWAILRGAGFDPAVVAQRMRALAERAIAARQAQGHGLAEE